MQESFVCGWEQRGILEVHVVRQPVQSQTLGGNVVTWVCMPDRRVLHAIPGAPGADRLLSELKWALDLHRATRALATLDERRAHVARARDAREPGWRLGGEELLRSNPLALVEELEQDMFVGVLGQTYDTLGALVVREVKQLRLRIG